MSKYGGGKNKIQFDVGFNVDKSGLDSVKKSLQDLQNIKPVNFSGTEEELSQIKLRAKEVESALENAFNVKLNSMNVQEFYNQLGITDNKLDEIYADFAKLGPQGRSAFNQVATSLTTTNTQLRQSAGLLQKMGQTMTNTVKWGIASSVMNSFTNSVQQAFQYVKSLDSALTDIRIVTGDSRQEMAKFADQANRAASELGRSTMEYSKAALTFYQQGLGDEDVQARTEAVLKAQNITGAGSEMADYLTAVWNGYKVANEEAELYVDKLAAVADSSASNMSQLAVAMSKVASTANMLGVPVDSLNAQIATIVATTRQAPESVGNALKTIYARINDIATGADDAEVSLGNYSEKMMAVGISVLDANGRLRDTGDVIDEIGGKWQTLSREQQIYLARTMAGQRQYNNLLALFENWGKYTDLVNVSMESQGATMEKNSRYMESLEAHLNQLGAASERVKSAMVDADSFKGLVDIGTSAVTLFANLIESIGGGGNALLALGSIATQVFSGIISRQISNAIIQARTNKQIYEQMRQVMAQTQSQSHQAAYNDSNNAAYREYIDNLRQIHQSWSVLSQDERQAQERRIVEIRENSERVAALREYKRQAEQLASALTGGKGDLAAGNRLQAIKDATIELQNSIKQTQQVYSTFIKNLNQSQDSAIASDIEKTDIAIMQLQTRLQNLGKSTNNTGVAQALIDGLERLKNNADIAEEQISALQNQIEKFLNQTSGKAVSILNYNQNNKEIEELTNKLKQLDTAVKQVNENSKTAFNTQRVVTFVASIGQLASGVTSIVNLFKVWKNDSLTTGEKLLQTFTNLGFVIPMMVNAFNKLRTALGAEVILQQKKLLTEKLITLQKQKQLMLQNAQNSSSALESLQNLTQVANIEKNIANTTKELNNLPNIFSTMSTTVQGSLASIGSGITSFLSTPLLAIPGLTVGVVAGFTAIAAVIGISLVQAYDKAKNAAEQATKQAQEAKKIYSETRSQATELSNAFSSLNSAQDNLKNLTQGTQAWRDALQDVNSQVLQLIEKFPELQSYVTTTADGMLTFQNGAQETVSQIYQKRVQASGAAYLASEQGKTQAINNSLIQDYARQIGLADSFGFGNEILTKVVEAVQTHGNYILGDTEALKNLAKLNDSQAQKVIENSAKIAELTAKVQNNTDATDNLTASITKSNLSGIRQYEQSDNKEVYAAMFANMQKNAQLNKNKYIIEEARDDSGIQTSYNTQAMIQKYAELYEIEEQNLRIRGHQLQIKNEQGKFENKMSLQILADTIAQAEFLENTDQVYEQIAQNMKNIKSKFGDFSNQAYEIALAGNDLSKVNVNNFSLDSIAYFRENIEELSKFTGSSVDDLNKSLDQMRDSSLKNYSAFYRELSPLLKNTFDKLIDLSNQNDYSVAAAQAMADMLKKGIEKGGVEGFNIVEELLQQISPEDIAPFEKLISTVDISSLSIEQLNQLFNDSGLNLDITNPKLLQFVDLIKQAGDAVNPQQYYKNIHDVIDGLETGDIIDPDQAKALQEAGVHLEDYFTKMGDGSFKLLQDAKTFYNEVNELSLQPFKQGIEQSREKIIQFSEMMSSGQAITDSAWTGNQNENGVDTYSGKQLDAQIEALKLISAADQDILELQVQRAKGLQLNKQQVELIQTAVEQHKQQLSDVSYIWDLETQKVRQYQEQIVNSVKDFDELHQLVDQGIIDYDSDLYERGRAEAIEQAAERIGYSSELYQAYADALEGAILANEDFLGSEEEAAEASQKMVQSIYNLNAGLEDLQSVWDDTYQIIEQGNAIIADGGIADPAYYESIAAMSDALERMFGVQVSPDLLNMPGVLDMVRQAAQGDIAVLDELGQLCTQQYVMDIAAHAHTEEAEAALNSLADMIGNMDLTDIEIGASLDDTQFVNALNTMLANATITEAQANQILAGIGYVPDITYVPANTVSDSQAHGDTVSHQTSRSVIHFPPEMGGDVEVETFNEERFVSNGGMYEAGTVMVPQINGKGTTYRPASSSAMIKGASKAPSHGGTRKPASAPKSSGGGSKGGSKKSSTPKAPKETKAKQPKAASQEKGVKESKDQKHIQAQKDVYHDINILLEKQEDKLKDIQKRDKKLINKDRLKNIEKQNKELEKQKKLLGDKNSIAAGELSRLRTQLGRELGNGIKFNEKNGDIANYNQALQNAAKKYNKQIDAYNKRVSDAEANYNNWINNVYNQAANGDIQNALKTEKDIRKQQMDNAKEAAKQILNTEKERYQTIQNNIKEYEKTLELQKDIADKIKEIDEQIYDNLIKKFKINVDLALDTGELERDWLNFENKFIKKLDSKDFLGNAKANMKELMSYFNSTEVQKTHKQIQNIRKQIEVMKEGGTSNIYGDNMDQAKEDLENYMKQLQDSLMDIQDLIDDIKDNYLDAIDDAKDKMDDQIDQYERVNNLIEHQVKMTELLFGDKAYQSLDKYYKLQQDNDKKTLESLKMQQDYWRQRMNQQVVGSDAWKKFKDNLDDVTDNLNSKLEDMIDNLAKRFETQVSASIQRTNLKITSGRGLDFLDEQWDYINDFDDEFLDTVNSKMGTEEVERLYKSAYDGLAGNPKQQQKINNLMNDQLKILREKDKLTQYDIDRAKALLEVEQARMALEDARNAKTKMRLRRDSQGNYTYQYVADEQKLGELQDALADAQNNLYNQDKEHYKQNLNKLYDTYKDYIEKMRDLTAEYNATQDEEERARIQKRIDLLKEATNKMMQGLTEDNKYNLQYLTQSFFDAMGIDPSKYTAQEQIEIMNQNIPQMQSNIQDLANTIVGEGGILNATADMINQISQATKAYDQNVKSVLETAGTSVEQISTAIDGEGNTLDKTITDAQKLIAANDELIKSCDAQVTAMQKMLDYLDKYMNKIINVNQLIDNLRNAYNLDQSLNDSKLQADEIDVTSNNLDTTAGTEYTGNPATDAAKIKKQIDALMAEYEKYLASMAIATFDTGGMTAGWGDAEGRLAFLHEKELVLNATDTANILAAVDSVRQMTSMMDIGTGLLDLQANMSNMVNGIQSSGILDQNVHIEANFPNVTQHTEIEQAFNNLVNMASMHASRYKD